MEAIKEVTEWPEDMKPQPNHIYLMDGDKAVAYIKYGEGNPLFFSSPFRLVRSRRKFIKADVSLFGQQKKSNLTEVKGSKGDSYFVDYDARTCTCPGFQFRGLCKHLNRHS